MSCLSLTSSRSFSVSKTITVIMSYCCAESESHMLCVGGGGGGGDPSCRGQSSPFAEDL